MKQGVPQQGATTTNYIIPEENNDRISMSNISEQVIREVKRLELELINDMSEVLEFDLKYDSIDYVPEDDPNAITEEQLERYSFMSQFNKIFNSINSTLRLGDTTDSENFDMVEYLKRFTVTYKNDGIANLTLNIPMNTRPLSSLKIITTKGNRGVDLGNG